MSVLVSLGTNYIVYKSLPPLLLLICKFNLIAHSTLTVEVRNIVSSNKS